MNISGTELREKLKKGELPDPGIMRPETARVLAEKLLKQHADTETRLTTAFRLLTSRTPTVREREVLTRLYREQHERFRSAVSEHDLETRIDTEEDVRFEVVEAAHARR